MNFEEILGMSVPRQPSMLQAKMGATASPPQKVASWLFREPALPFGRRPAELVVSAMYLLPILSALQLVISTPDAPPGPPSSLLIGGLLVGLVGLAYPTRRLVAIALCLYWVGVAVFAAQRFEGGALVAVPITIVSAGFLYLCDRIERNLQRDSRVALSDATRAAFLSTQLGLIKQQVPATVPGVSGTTTLNGLGASEVTRHFDSNLEASVNGMLFERMSYGGWGAGVGIGHFSLGLNRGTGVGTSTVRLGVQGTIREDMTDDSFTAVLERTGPGGPDVVRLIVPSAGSVREYVRNMLWEWQRSLQVNSRSELAVRIQTDTLADRLVCDAPYVADRLGVIIRMDPSKRPAIAVVGTTVNDHSLLAGAIQFGPDRNWYQLFPTALINAISDLMNGRTPSPRPPTPPGPGIPDEASATEPAPIASVAAPASANGQLADSTDPQSGRETGKVLSVTTIGQFGLNVGSEDVTTALQQKPVASFLWLYTLARALRNPKDFPSRPALADEVFPNLDPKQQRTRLRQRLSDMQNSLPPAIGRCLVSDGERVRFDLSACSVDLLQLREATTALASTKTALDGAQLENLESLAVAIGDGAFLPEWEALEAKVTAGQGSAISVIETVRADVERCRAALLVAISDGHLARNQPTLAIPYLERVNRFHPENEPAAKKLIAAYLETGQPDRARQLQKDRL
jgi:DNA-binding SARP family transcriptional activator